jgi:hypothetical protein
MAKVPADEALVVGDRAGLVILRRASHCKEEVDELAKGDRRSLRGLE